MQVDYTTMTAVGTAKLSREEYINAEAVRVGRTAEHLLRFHHVVECRCGQPGCPGWRTVWKSAAERS